jgi:hypothetical protein
VREEANRVLRGEPIEPRKSTLDDGEKLGWNERVTRAGTPSSPGGDGDRPVQA